MQLVTSDIFTFDSFHVSNVLQTNQVWIGSIWLFFLLLLLETTSICKESPTPATTTMDDFDLYDIVDEANFDQFIEIFREECGNSEVGFNAAEYATGNNYSDHLVNGAAAFSLDNHFDLEPGLPDAVFEGLNSTSSVNVFEQNPLLLPLPGIDVMDDLEEELGDGEEDQNDSSTTTSTKTSNAGALKKPKADRSKTLVSERRRRGRMKEKLYALRSLVPYISKMDKASIVGDAVHYIQELQTKARNLKKEINDLEISILNQPSIEQPRTFRIERKQAVPICRTAVQMEVFQVEEKGFYMRIVSQKGDGIASQLYRAIESLDEFNVQNSNLCAGSDNFVLTVKEGSSRQEMSLSKLKLWITAALFNHGFDLQL